jgi:hypothetical protein
MGACRVNYWFRCPHGSNKTTPTTSAIAPMARRRADRPIVPTKAPTTTGTAIEITAPHDQRHGEAGPSCWCSPWARPPDRPHDAAPLEPGREPELTQPGRQRWRVRRQVATEHEDFEDREAERGGSDVQEEVPFVVSGPVQLVELAAHRVRVERGEDLGGEVRRSSLDEPSDRGGRDPSDGVTRPLGVVPTHACTPRSIRSSVTGSPSVLSSRSAPNSSQRSNAG